ncbi:MAG: sodium/solute symporter [Planctomycetes bacterium]|nr:sodium/solute symporter [Planctomycetota bacterium]
MSLHWIDIAIIAVYLLGLLGFGLCFSRFVKTEEDYFLAGRNLPFWAIGMSIVVSDIGAIDFVSLTGASYRYGIAAANMDWIGTLPAIIIASLIFIPYYWRAGVYSVPEYMGRRYDQRVRAVQSIIWTIYLVLILGAMFLAAAKMFENLLGARPWAGLIPEDAVEIRLWTYVLVTAAFTGAYTVAGGLAAVVYTDVVQLVIMFLGALIVLAIGFQHPDLGAGGLSGLRESLESAGHDSHFSLFLPHDTKTPYPWTGVLFGLALVQAPAYFIGNQQIVQRTLGARDEWSAKAGTLFAGALKFFIPILVVLPGLLALALYPQLEDADQAYGQLIKDLLPVGLTGLVFAGFLAALMSSVDSFLTSAASIISRDIITGLCRVRLDDRSLLRLGKLLTLVLVVFGVATVPFCGIFAGIYEFIQAILSIVQGPTWALLLIGMFWRRATASGGFVALLAGLAVGLGLTIWQKAAEAGARPFQCEEPFMFIALVSFLSTAGVLVAASLATRPRPVSELRGLVFRATFHDTEAQSALEARGGEEEP